MVSDSRYVRTISAHISIDYVGKEPEAECTIYREINILFS